jgi:hypothetical protein
MFNYFLFVEERKVKLEEKAKPLSHMLVAEGGVNGSTNLNSIISLYSVLFCILLNANKIKK